MEGCKFELRTSLDAHFNFMLLTESSCKAPSLQLHHLLASLTSTQLGSQFSLTYDRHSKQQIPSPSTGAMLSAHDNHPTLVKRGRHSGNIHNFVEVLCFAVIVLCVRFALRSGGKIVVCIGNENTRILTILKWFSWTQHVISQTELVISQNSKGNFSNSTNDFSNSTDYLCDFSNLKQRFLKFNMRSLQLHPVISQNPASDFSNSMFI